LTILDSCLNLLSFRSPVLISGTNGLKWH